MGALVLFALYLVVVGDSSLGNEFVEGNSGENTVGDTFEGIESILASFFKKEVSYLDENGDFSQEGNRMEDYGENQVKRSLGGEDVYKETKSIERKSLKKNRDEIKLEKKLSKKYLNEWVVHMTGGMALARHVIEDLGYNFYGPVMGFKDVYRVSQRLQHHNHRREAHFITNHIRSHAEVLWAEQQVSQIRDKRRIASADTVKSKRTNRGRTSKAKGSPNVNHLKELRRFQKMFNDPLWKHQWYLFDTRTRGDLPELDLKLIPVWESGITGKGVNVLVLDDGLEWRHDDLVDNYNPDISYDLNDDDFDPTPRYDESRSNSHGTRCAGEIVMAPNNQKCGVGVATGASIGGIRMLDGEVSDRIEGGSLAMGLSSVDIVSCSWGPSDDGKRVEGPGTLAKMALETGVTKGRNGKGNIFVWAAGNGGSVDDNCNCDGYASSIYTISVATATENGDSPWYSEHCASTITSTYSSGAYSDQKIVTTDLENECTVSFSGTSAAAPLAAGIIALSLEANPLMTWRDVQHAIVRASEWSPLSHDDGWQINGAGLRYNVKFGFGLLTAEALVAVARNWTQVPSKNICISHAHLKSEMKITSGDTMEIDIPADCNSNTEVTSLEHIQVKLTLNHTRRGSLRISLTSPLGTVTDLLTPRPFDDSTEGFCDWPFTSVHTWAENPNGNWVVAITDTSEADQSGSVSSVSLVLHGI